MSLGMLWLDPDPKLDLSFKLTFAVDYFKKKYGQTPNKCSINPKDFPPQKDETVLILNGMEIHPDQYILPNHFFIELEKPDEIFQEKEN